MSCLTEYLIVLLHSCFSKPPFYSPLPSIHCLNEYRVFTDPLYSVFVLELPCMYRMLLYYMWILLHICKGVLKLCFKEYEGWVTDYIHSQVLGILTFPGSPQQRVIVQAASFACICIAHLNFASHFALISPFLLAFPCFFYTSFSAASNWHWNWEMPIAIFLRVRWRGTGEAIKAFLAF